MEASMKRIWWPFCLLTLSRRIMCLEELSSAGVRPSAEGEKRQQSVLVAFRHPSVRAGRHRSGACGGIRSLAPRIRSLVITYQVEFKGKALRPRRKKIGPGAAAGARGG